MTDGSLPLTRARKYRETYRRYYEKNREAITQKNLNWKHSNPEKFLYNSIRQRAKRAGIEFDLQVEDITIPDKCPYLQTPFEFATEYAPSVDRRDNSKGYIKGNVEVISLKANRMKNSATQEELELFAKRILNEVK